MTTKWLFIRSVFLFMRTCHALALGFIQIFNRLFRLQIAYLQRHTFIKQLAARLGLQTEFGLLLVDITNIEAIQRKWGMATANACIAHVERTLNTMAFTVDLVGKVKSSRFALACLHPYSNNQLQNMGLHMIACGLADHQGQLASVAIRIRTVVAVVDAQSTSSQQILERMEQVLHHSPRPFTWVDALFPGTTPLTIHNQGA